MSLIIKTKQRRVVEYIANRQGKIPRQSLLVSRVLDGRVWSLVVKARLQKLNILESLDLLFGVGSSCGYQDRVVKGKVTKGSDSLNINFNTKGDKCPTSEYG